MFQVSKLLCLKFYQQIGLDLAALLVQLVARRAHKNLYVC